MGVRPQGRAPIASGVLERLQVLRQRRLLLRGEKLSTRLEDPLGWTLLESEDPKGLKTRFEYDDAGQRTKVVLTPAARRTPHP
jgi:YD repeat-containing protein